MCKALWMLKARHKSCLFKPDISNVIAGQTKSCLPLFQWDNGFCKEDRYEFVSLYFNSLLEVISKLNH